MHLFIKALMRIAVSFSSLYNPSVFKNTDLLFIISKRLRTSLPRPQTNISFGNQRVATMKKKNLIAKVGMHLRFSSQFAKDDRCT